MWFWRLVQVVSLHSAQRSPAPRLQALADSPSLFSLHDRGDYLHGWQMDSILSLPSSAPVIAEAVEEELPFACIICRQPFGAPPHDAVVTRCGHYFGGSCAIKR